MLIPGRLYFGQLLLKSGHILPAWIYAQGLGKIPGGRGEIAILTIGPGAIQQAIDGRLKPCFGTSVFGLYLQHHRVLISSRGEIAGLGGGGSGSSQLADILGRHPLGLFLGQGGNKRLDVVTRRRDILGIGERRGGQGKITGGNSSIGSRQMELRQLVEPLACGLVACVNLQGLLQQGHRSVRAGRVVG